MTGDGVQVCLVTSLARERNVIQITPWWLQRWGETVSYQTNNVKFDTERFSFKKLNEVEDKEQYQVKLSNRFTALEDLR
jgi:hypothetical protein